MQFLKSMSLFLLVNIAVMLTISFIIKAFKLEPLLQGHNINYSFLLVFCLGWGMLGAFISLMLSKFMAKMMMGLEIIDPNTTNPHEKQLINMVSKLCMKAELKVMPEVAIYRSDTINAFATGPSRNNALVAVSTGLLNRMNQKEVEGVLGHEIAHIANGDMVTMTLLQGVVNAFAMFLARIIAALIMRSGKSDDRNHNNNYLMEHLVRLVLEMAFMVLGSIVVRWFSRYREYRADAGGAKYAGKQNMIDALKALMNPNPITAEDDREDGLNTLKISNHKNAFLDLFRTHPKLEDRIARLMSNKDY